MLVLRFFHVFFVALWVGMMAFQTFFLMPALAEVGPDSGKLMAALMRRRIPVILPIVALRSRTSLRTPKARVIFFTRPENGLSPSP